MYLIALIIVCLKTCTISTEEDIVYYNVLDMIALITICLKTCTISTEEDSVYYNVLGSFDNSLSEDLYNINRRRYCVLQCTWQL